MKSAEGKRLLDLHEFSYLLYLGNFYGVVAEKMKDPHANRTIPPFPHSTSD